ncbi:MAG: hypothetical protein ACI86L_001615, partial [Dokdonia sp.]
KIDLIRTLQEVDHRNVSIQDGWVFNEVLLIQRPIFFSFRINSFVC